MNARDRRREEKRFAVFHERDAKGGSSPVIAAILFFVSMVAFCQFALYYWRASIANTASRQVSDRVKIAAGIPSSVTSRDFRALLTVYEVTPDLAGSGRAFRTIRAYYFIVEKIARVIPPLTSWAETEMAMCSRYAAVLVDQLLESNINCAAHLRGI
jgi:hypothetical protein